MRKVAIIGSGSFGCALAYLLSKNDNEIKIWSFTEEEKNIINNEHKCKLLPGLLLDEKIICSNSYEEVIKDSDYIILVSPSNVFRKTCNDIKEYINSQKIIIASKGLENDKLLSDVTKEVLGIEPYLLYGPSHAEQIIKDMPTFVEYYGSDEIKEMFESESFKLYKNEDHVGMELGAALKNVITLGYGILEGKGYESNTISYFITKGLEEIKNIGLKMGAKESTFYGISGLGDLIATFLGMDSRNKRAGILIGQGKSIDEAKKEVGMTVEGLDALKNINILIDKYHINSSVFKSTYNIVYGNEK